MVCRLQSADLWLRGEDTVFPGAVNSLGGHKWEEKGWSNEMQPAFGGVQQPHLRVCSRLYVSYISIKWKQLSK